MRRSGRDLDVGGKQEEKKRDGGGVDSKRQVLKDGGGWRRREGNAKGPGRGKIEVKCAVKA